MTMLTKDGCLLWTGHVINGYGQVKIDGGRQAIHRLVFERSNGKIPTGLVVRHVCDRPLCIRLEHLVVGTQADNVGDMDRRGRANRTGTRGEKNGRSLLRENEVVAIKTLLGNGIPVRELAARFGVTAAAIYDIRRGKNWKHVHQEAHGKRHRA